MDFDPYVAERRLAALESRVKSLEAQMKAGVMLPANLSLLAADAEHIASIANQMGVSTLVPRQRTAVIATLRREGWKVARIGRAMGMDPESVRRHLHRAGLTGQRTLTPQTHHSNL